jgi:chorismate--pyruvate lyase
LTRRLRTLCESSFRVQVLGEDWRKPFCGEARLLRVHSPRRAWVREVVLFAGDSPLVLARSVIPREGLRHTQLVTLGQRPLGEWLFAHAQLQRLSLEFTRVEPQEWCSDLAQALGLQVPVWGRRSLYRVPRRQLLVCEFFLPPLLRLSSDVRGSE